MFLCHVGYYTLSACKGVLRIEVVSGQLGAVSDRPLEASLLVVPVLDRVRVSWYFAVAVWIRYVVVCLKTSLTFLGPTICRCSQ